LCQARGGDTVQVTRPPHRKYIQNTRGVYSEDTQIRGGFGYLLKDRVLDVADFLAAVDRVARGGSALDPYVVGQLMHRTDGRHGLQDLTERDAQDTRA